MNAPVLLTAWEAMLTDPDARAAWETAVVADERAAAAWDAVRVRDPAWEHGDEVRARHHHRHAAIGPLKDALLRRLRDGDVLAMGFLGDGIERAPVPPAVWEGFGVYVDPDRHVGRLADGCMVTGLRFRVEQAAPAPSAPVDRPRTRYDAYREFYEGFLAEHGFDRGDPSKPIPTLAEVEKALVGLVPRDAIRSLQKEAYGEIASRRGRRVGRLKQD